MYDFRFYQACMGPNATSFVCDCALTLLKIVGALHCIFDTIGKPLTR